MVSAKHLSAKSEVSQEQRRDVMSVYWEAEESIDY